MTDPAASTADTLAIRISKVHEYAPWGRTMTFQLVKEGVLPVRRLGGMTYVMREDLDRVLRQAPVLERPPV